MDYGSYAPHHYNSSPGAYVPHVAQQSYAPGVGLPYQPGAFHAPPPPPVPQQTHQNIRSDKCQLKVRQEPVDALAIATGKEKTRKPLDPPPIVEFFVDEDLDPSRLYMNSPNLFCMAHLCATDNDLPHQLDDNEPPMVGTLCSSVHRLKEGPDTEGAFFIFGDVSVKVPGLWRLRFTLYDIPFNQVGGKPQERARQLATTFSNSFNVLQGKEFKGLGESTALTRIFSDQGVRLRLRKEQRAAKRKIEDRSPSADRESTDLLAMEKRSRFEDYSEPIDHFSAGPVQPFQDNNYAAGTLGLNDTAFYSAGPVQQPSSSHSTPFAPYLVSNNSLPPSRYQERLQENIYGLTNGNNTHNAYTAYHPF